MYRYICDNLYFTQDAETEMSTILTSIDLEMMKFQDNCQNQEIQDQEIITIETGRDITMLKVNFPY